MSAPERKQEKDYTKEVETAIQEADGHVSSGKLQDAVDRLVALEKLTRNASDLSSTTTLLLRIPTLCYQAQSWSLLNSSLALLAKRHGQLKEAAVKMCDLAVGWLPELQSTQPENVWLELTKTIRTITEGKIFLELPRARATLLLSKYHEAKADTAPETAPSTSTPTPAPSTSTTTAGSTEKPAEKEPVTKGEHLAKAADLIADLGVESFSSMPQREKTEFILDGMRLDSKRAEWTKVKVGGRKINRKFLNEKDNSDLKLVYYALVIELALEENDFMDACKSWQEVYDTDSVREDEQGKARQALEMVIYYIILAPFSNEQNDMINRLKADSKYERNALQYELLKSFTTPELMRWPGMEPIWGPTLRATSVFSEKEKKGEYRWEELHKRVVEHNIRTVALYYTRISLARLAALLDLTVPETEEKLSTLVVAKEVYAKIDRVSGIVTFIKKRTAEEVLDEWRVKMEAMMKLVDGTGHLINKEYAVHAAKLKA